MSSRFPESSVLKRIFIESIHDCMVWDEIKDLSVPELLEELNDKKNEKTWLEIMNADNPSDHKLPDSL